MARTIPFQANNIVVGTSLTLLLDIPTAGLDGQLSFEVISAAGSAANNNFAIVRRLHDAGTCQQYMAGDEFATTSSRCMASIPGPHQLPGGSSAWVDIDCGAAVSVQLWASVAAGTATLSIFGGGKF